MSDARSGKDGRLARRPSADACMCTAWRGATLLGIVGSREKVPCWRCRTVHGRRSRLAVRRSALLLVGILVACAILLYEAHRGSAKLGDTNSVQSGGSSVAVGTTGPGLVAAPVAPPGSGAPQVQLPKLLRVVDEVDRHPIVGATIRHVADWSRPGDEITTRAPRVVASWTTDERGCIDVPAAWAEGGDQTDQALIATASGHEHVVVRELHGLIVREGARELSLAPAAWCVTGQVVSNGGRPLAGVTLVAWSPEQLGLTEMREALPETAKGLRSVVTDVQGRFSIPVGERGALLSIRDDLWVCADELRAQVTQFHAGASRERAWGLRTMPGDDVLIRASRFLVVAIRGVRSDGDPIQTRIRVAPVHDGLGITSPMSIPMGSHHLVGMRGPNAFGEALSVLYAHADSDVWLEPGETILLYVSARGYEQRVVRYVVPPPVAGGPPPWTDAELRPAHGGPERSLTLQVEREVPAGCEPSDVCTLNYLQGPDTIFHAGELVAPHDGFRSSWRFRGLPADLRTATCDDGYSQPVDLLIPSPEDADEMRVVMPPPVGIILAAATSSGTVGDDVGVFRYVASPVFMMAGRQVTREGAIAPMHMLVEPARRHPSSPASDRFYCLLPGRHEIQIEIPGRDATSLVIDVLSESVQRAVLPE